MKPNQMGPIVMQNGLVATPKEGLSGLLSRASDVNFCD